MPDRLGLVAVGLAVVLGLGSVVGAAPARAHNELVASVPADGARAEAAPSRVELVFDRDVRPEAAVVVTGPDGADHAGGNPQVAGSTVTVPLRPLGRAGTYEAAYRVVSADGHPIAGTIRFAAPAAEATAPTDATALPEAIAPTDATARAGAGNLGGSAGDESPSSWALPAVGAGGVALVLLTGAVSARRRRTGRGPADG
jgi:copper resistance protein C